MPTYPMARVDVEAFGPFSAIDVTLSPQLNVIVGDNGTGKSQLLKLLYTCTRSLSSSSPTDSTLTKRHLSSTVAENLLGVFRPNQLGRLTNRTQGRARAAVSVKYDGISHPLSFNFATNASSEVKVENHPDRHLKDTPVFLPSRELLSVHPGFVALYNAREIHFDQTWRDTAELLDRNPLKGAREKKANELLASLAGELEGRIARDSTGFYLHRPGVGNIEAHLMAEGQRKLGMIERLVTSGVLLEGGYLFWDEPEANLNPRAQKAVARTIATLARHGSQIIVATHSLFLLRELQLVMQDGGATSFIGLIRTKEGVVAESVEDLDDLTTLTALEAETEQSLRYLYA